MAKTRKPRESMTLAAGSKAPTAALSYDRLSQKQRPTALNTLFTRCREIADEYPFLASYYPLKRSFYNYGMALSPGPLATGKADALAKWLAEDVTTVAEYTDPTTNEVLQVELNMSNQEAIESFVDDVWKEFLLLDNVVAMWTDNMAQPITLPPERCRFFDVLGVPVLYYTHGLSVQQMELLPPDQRQRFTEKSEIMINPKEGEHFKVLKRGMVGTGFNKPRLYSALRVLGEHESKEIGFHAMAWLMRGATRQHKLGHEITAGQHAGKGTWFWKKERHLAALTQFEGREGPHEFTSNFDHEIVFPWPDLKIFEDTAFKGSNKRLCDWGGPVAQMLLAEKVVEGGLAYLRAEVTEDRKLVANFLRPIIKAVFKGAEAFDLRVNWSDLVFNDPKQAAELMKFSVQQGYASITTAQRMVGMRPSEEGANKLAESADPDAKAKFLPMFDMSHGITPALGMLNDPAAANPAQSGSGPNPGKTNGRPAGS